MEVTLECKSRTESTKARALRREGFIPANLYGHKGAESISLVLSQKEVVNLLKKASVNNTLVNLIISDLDWQGKVLIREVQTHPWKRQIHHISFFSPSDDRAVEVIVPITITGTSVGIKQGGILEQMVNDVKVRCFPTNIPEYLEMDISNVDIGQSFLVGNLQLPEGAVVLDDPNKAIISIAAPRKKG